MTEEKTLSVQEAADLLGVHIKTVRSWADRGLIPVLRWPNGWRRFRRADLDAARVAMGVEQPAPDDELYATVENPPEHIPVGTALTGAGATTVCPTCRSWLVPASDGTGRYCSRHPGVRFNT